MIEVRRGAPRDRPSVRAGSGEPKRAARKARARAPRPFTRLSLAGLSRPIDFIGCPELASGFCAILRGWDITEIAADGGPEPLLGVRRTARGYRWVPGVLPMPEDWKSDPPTTLMDAICELQYEFFEWYLRDNPAHLCLHCAAVEIGGGLVVVPNPTRAGKSTLTVQLAAAGCRVYCDDVLPVEPVRGHGVALGVLPRLRRPLAPSLGPRVLQFIAEREGPSNHRYCYVDLGDDELARFGETAPIRSMVLLRRVEAAPAALAPVGHGEMLKLVIRRNFADAVPPHDIFGRFHALTGAARRLQLTYSDPAEAAALLQRELGAR